MKKDIKKKILLIAISLGIFFICDTNVNSSGKNNLHIKNEKNNTYNKKDNINKEATQKNKDIEKEDNKEKNNQEKSEESKPESIKADNVKIENVKVDNTKTETNQTANTENNKENQSAEKTSIENIPENNEKIDYKNKIRVDGNVSSDLINLLNDELNKVPKNIMDKYLNMGGKIILTSHDIATTYYNDYVIGSLMELYDARQQILYVSARSNAIKRGAVHGVGHIVDHISGWKSYKTNTFVNIYNEEKNKFKPVSGGKYHTTNEREFFAEIFYNLIKSPSTVKSTSPKASSFMIDIIKGI